MKFDENVLRGLISQIASGCDTYIQKYKELTDLVDSVQNGTFSGEVATVFQNAYNSHKKTFTDVTTDIEDKGQEIKTKTDAGVDLLEELKGTIN